MYLKQEESNIFSRYVTLLKEQNAAPPADETNKLEDPEYFRMFEDRLLASINHLYKNHRFYGITLRQLKTVPTFTMPTMAVDDYNNIFINPDFLLNELSIEEAAGVLAHECLHIIGKHLFRLGNRDMSLFNWATDFIINMNCLQDGMALPKMGLIPQQSNGRWYAKVKGKNGDMDIDITDLIPEELYDILADNADKIDKDGMNQQQQEMDKHVNDQTGRPQIPNNASDNDSYKADGPSGGDGKAKSESEREAQAEDIKKKSLGENKKDQSRGMGGSVPRMISKEEETPKVNWRQILKRYLKVSASSYETYMRPSRRGLARGMIQKGERNFPDKVDVVVACDTSGSITPEILNLYTAEIVSISKAYKSVSILLVLWTTEVYFAAKIERGAITPIYSGAAGKPVEKNQKLTISTIPYKEGGTILSSVHRWFNENRALAATKAKVLIVFTDGHVESTPVFPKQFNKKNTVFMVNDPQSGGTDDIVKKYGTAIYVKVGKYT
jgi:predicted metal-dependent peptidase